MGGGRYSNKNSTLGEDSRSIGGRVSLLLQRHQSPTEQEPWVGLLLDEWVESIPNSDEDTALVYHYDTPGAQAPQVVLIAVSARSQQRTLGLGIAHRYSS